MQLRCESPGISGSLFRVLLDRFRRVVSELWAESLEFSVEQQAYCCTKAFGRLLPPTQVPYEPLCVKLWIVMHVWQHTHCSFGSSSTKNCVATDLHWVSPFYELCPLYLLYYLTWTSFLRWQHWSQKKNSLVLMSTGLPFSEPVSQVWSICLRSILKSQTQKKRTWAWRAEAKETDYL